MPLNVNRFRLIFDSEQNMKLNQPNKNNFQVPSERGLTPVIIEGSFLLASSCVDPFLIYKRSL